MQSNNPIFRRSEEFNRGGANLYGNQTYAGNGAPMAGYGQTTDPSQWGVGTPGDTARAPATTGPMTIDSVVQKTAITLGVVDRLTADGHLDPDRRHITADNAETVNLGAALRGGDDRLARRVRAVDGQLVQAGISPALVLAFCRRSRASRSVRSASSFDT